MHDLKEVVLKKLRLLIELRRNEITINLSKCWLLYPRFPVRKRRDECPICCGFTHNLLKCQGLKIWQQMVEKAYKFRFYPTPEQESLLRMTIGCVRLIYNLALAARTQAWYEKKERVSYKQTSAMLTSWKKQEDLDFLKELSSVPLQ